MERWGLLDLFEAGAVTAEEIHEGVLNIFGNLWLLSDLHVVLYKSTVIGGRCMGCWRRVSNENRVDDRTLIFLGR